VKVVLDPSLHVRVGRGAVAARSIDIAAAPGSYPYKVVLDPSTRQPAVHTVHMIDSMYTSRREVIQMLEVAVPATTSH
jgi:hypothetical protein